MASSCDYLVALEHVFPVALDSVDFPRLEALEHRLECLELRARGVCVGVARPYKGEDGEEAEGIETGGGLTSDRSCCAPSKTTEAARDEVPALQHRLVVGENAVDFHERRDRHDDHRVVRLRRHEAGVTDMAPAEQAWTSSSERIALFK